MVAKIQKRLTEEGISFSDVSEYSNGEVNVLIEWGDWKHDHLYCDVIMKEFGYELSTATTTEEDGSDCYSAIRSYSPKSN
jgi:hypothetical protein